MPLTDPGPIESAGLLLRLVARACCSDSRKEAPAPNWAGRAHWRRGCMREALRALIACAFGRMALRRLEAEVDPRNTSSGRLLLQLGFEKEGLLRQGWVSNGQARDVEI